MSLDISNFNSGDATPIIHPGTISILLDHFQKKNSILVKDILWADYTNPRPELDDVDSDKRTYATGEASLFINNEKIPYAHGSDVMYHVMGLMIKLLQRDETINDIDLKFLKLVKNSIKIHIIDSSMQADFDKTKASFRGSATTSAGRKLEFYVFEKKDSPIAELRLPNFYSIGLLEGAKIDKGEFYRKVKLNHELHEKLIVGFGRSKPVQVSAMIEMLVFLSSDIIHEIDPESRGLILRIRNLPCDMDILKYSENGGSIIVEADLASNKKLSSGLQMTPISFSFEGRSQKTIMNIAHTSDEVFNF